MKVKTSELTGAALDWAVAKCEGNLITFADGTGPAPAGTPSGMWDMYASLWEEGGPIIEREGIAVREIPPIIGKAEVISRRWLAEMFHAPGKVRKALGYGPTPLIAAMRCFLVSRLGDEIEIPDELLQ